MTVFYAMALNLHLFDSCTVLMSSAMSISAPMLSVPPYSTTSTPRLQALYSDFSRQKQSNPTSYQSNIEWWRKGLETIVSSGLQTTQHTVEETSKSDRLVLHAGRELLELVKLPKVGKPLALGAVIVRIVNQKKKKKIHFL